MPMRTAARPGTDLVDLVRERIAAGAPVREIEPMDLPLWAYRDLDLRKPIRSIFQSAHAVLVVYADGSRMLRRTPAGLLPAAGR